MGMKSDNILYHQGCNNVSNFEYNNNSTLISIYDNNNNNAQINKDFRIGKQNVDTFSTNQDHPRNDNLPNRKNNADLIIFHQNIRGLNNKIDELLNFWTTEFPHIFCLTEHHLCDHEINTTCIKYYSLGAKHCRKSCKYGGVSTFVHETLLFSTAELNEFCKDQDLEVCAVKLCNSSFLLCILCVYRPPTGNFSYFLSSLESILNQLYTNSINITICGDININYLDNTNNKLQLDSLLASYDLYSTVDFPTRINNCSSTTINNIFTDKFKNTNFTINPLPDGLSNHDAQTLILHNIKIQNLNAHHYTKRQIKEFTISEFKLNLSYESWDEIFTENNVDSIFNSFLNTYLRIFYHSFPLEKLYHNQNNKAWITTGIKVSSQYKRDLYLLCRSTNDPKLKNHYKTYCRILSDVIKTAKKLYYNKLITNSKSKVKSI